MSIYLSKDLSLRPIYLTYLLGAPLPKATWRKNGQKVPVVMDQTPEFCKVKLKAVKRPDGGEYEMELVNEMGEDKVPITIKVIGKVKVN